MEVAGVVDGRAADGRERGQEAEIVLDEAAALRAALFFPADADDADDRLAGDHRREQQIAAGAAEELRDGDGHRLARGEDLLDRRLGQDRVRRRRDLDAEGEDLLDVELFVEREDEADRGIEHGDGAMHQLLEQLPFRPQRVQRAADVVKRLQLEELAAKLEVCDCVAPPNPFPPLSCTRRGENRSSSSHRTPDPWRRF